MGASVIVIRSKKQKLVIHILEGIMLQSDSAIARIKVNTK